MNEVLTTTQIANDAKLNIAEALVHLAGYSVPVVGQTIVSLTGLVDTNQSGFNFVKKLDQITEKAAEPLDEKKVQRAQLLVKQKHPLLNEPIWKVLPYLKYFKGNLKEY